MAAPATSAQASSKYLSINNYSNAYVRTKRTMYVGIYQKHGNTYRPLLKKKGSLLKVTDTEQKTSKSPVLASFTSGAVHYSRLTQLKFTDTPSIPLTKANFTQVTLKAPIRGTILRAGSGFKQDKAGNFGNSSAFYLTLDNYLQYYSKAAMIKNDPAGTMFVTNGRTAAKPSATAKMTKTTVKGNTTTVQYSSPIKGVPGNKLSAHNYQLKIKNLKTSGDNYFDDNSWHGHWDNYTINNKPFFSGMIYDFD